MPTLNYRSLRWRTKWVRCGRSGCEDVPNSWNPLPPRFAIPISKGFPPSHYPCYLRSERFSTLVASASEHLDGRSKSCLIAELCCVPSGVDLVTRIFDFSPQRRITAMQALDHYFFRQQVTQLPNLSSFGFFTAFPITRRSALLKECFQIFRARANSYNWTYFLWCWTKQTTVIELTHLNSDLSVSIPIQTECHHFECEDPEEGLWVSHEFFHQGSKNCQRE